MRRRRPPPAGPAMNEARAVSSWPAALAVTPAVTVAAQRTDNLPVEPFRIAGNLYYVGSSDIGSYLIATPAGHVVIDAGYESTVPLIEANIRALGFKVEDVRDPAQHAGARRSRRRLRGAEEGDRRATDGQRRGRGRHRARRHARLFTSATPTRSRPSHVDRRLKDGDTVTLGKLTLTAHLTPGHTMGCTTWTFEVTENSRELHVVDVCGLSTVLGTKRLERQCRGIRASRRTTSTRSRRCAAARGHLHRRARVVLRRDGEGGEGEGGSRRRQPVHRSGGVSQLYRPGRAAVQGPARRRARRPTSDIIKVCSTSFAPSLRRTSPKDATGDGSRRGFRRSRTAISTSATPSRSA